MPAGRPTLYCLDIVIDICSKIIEGQSVREIAAQDDMPSMATIFRWLAENEEFQEHYARAKEIQADFMAEEMLEIADDAENDYMKRKAEKGDIDGEHGWVTNGEAIQRSRLRIDSRKWLMGKMKPKKYGDKVTQEHTGADGGPIKTQAINFLPVGPEDK